jgi:simple sugar transport system ATP-binding protein
MDEPTSSLTRHEVEALLSRVGELKAKGISIMFVSHRLNEVMEVAERVTVLRDGRKVGTYPAAEIDDKKLAALMTGKSFHYDLKEMQAGELPVALAVENLTRRGEYEDVSFEVHAGEILGITGLLGSGRTETAETIFGITPHDSGRAATPEGELALKNPRDAIAHGFGFCPEDRKLDGIVGDLSVRENIALALQARRGWSRPLSRRRQMALADHYISRLDIRTSDAEKPVGLLSGGNQQKVILARWLAMNPRFLILDEPTRGIDVGAHAEIIRLIEELCEGGMSLLVISSELEELVAYSHRVIVVRDRAHVAELVGAAITPDAIVDSIAAHQPEAVA